MNEETIDPRSEVVLSEGAKKALANRFGGKLPPPSVLAQRYGAASVRNMTRSEEFRVAAQDVGGFAEQKRQKATSARAEIPPEVSARIEGARRNEAIAKTFFTGVSSMGLSFSMADQPEFTPATKASATATEPGIPFTQSKPVIGPKSSRIISGVGKALFTSLVPGVSPASFFANTRGAYEGLPEGAKSAIGDAASGFKTGAIRAIPLPSERKTAVMKDMLDRYAGPTVTEAATKTVTAGRSLLKKAREKLSE